MKDIIIPIEIREQFPGIVNDQSIAILQHMAFLVNGQWELMAKRSTRRKARIENGEIPGFLSADSKITGTNLTVAAARAGQFEGGEIPTALKRQWIQGTGPATRPEASKENSLRNVAYALLSGADGWMFDGEDALGQVSYMSMENHRNLKLAIDRDPVFMKVADQVKIEMNLWAQGFLGNEIIKTVSSQLGFTTILFRPRGLHLADRHIRLADGSPFSASIADAVFFIANNCKRLQAEDAPLVLYLPKIQTAEEAAFWAKILDTLEAELSLKTGTIKAYVLVEQLEAAFQLMEIRAALGLHFVGFNTGRWDYINSVSDALAGVPDFINPDIESITMTYAYMAAYEDRVRRAVNTPDKNGNYALWQGGMEPNIPVGSAEGIKAGMAKALAGASREQAAGASGKWVAHWKMVHIIRPIWEDVGEDNQLGRKFPTLSYDQQSADSLIRLGDTPRTIRGARNLISVALQYGNAFLRGYQAAALKPADFFGDDNILYLMEDMATGEIRVSVLWEWLQKETQIEIEQRHEKFTPGLFRELVEEEYQKLLSANGNDVHDDSKITTLPIARMIVEDLVSQTKKAPWYIDLLNLNLHNYDLKIARERIDSYYKMLKTTGERMIENLDYKRQYGNTNS